jgi:beta-galactosidase
MGGAGDWRGTGTTRRRVLQAGAAAAGSVAVLGASGVAAQARTVPGAASARSEKSFDEGWLFYRGDASGADTASFDDSSWQPLDLPHDWSIEDLPYATSTDAAATDYPSLLVYQSGAPAEPTPPQVIGPFDENNSAGGGATGYTVGGIGWYRKHFTYPDITGGNGSAFYRGEHAELRFDGVYQNADVWLNGAHLGFHPYGYTPFAYDLTPYLNRDGDNVLAVRVDNSGKTSRWYSGSGIYRHTWLTVTGAVRVPLWGVYVTTPTVAERGSVAHAEVSLANLGTAVARARVRVTVLDPRGEPVATQETATVSVAPGAAPVLAVNITVSPALLWSPESPSRYTARAEVLADDRVVDSTDTVFGIRSLEWSGTAGFLLNGQPVKVLGGCAHDTHGPLGAVGLDRTEERRVEILKAAGFNTIRTAHNPPTPALLEACDRLGMLVWDEFTDMWDTGKNPQDYSVYFPQWWPQDLTSMILRDRNHPSVVIWSLGNEIVEDSHYAQRGPQLAALVRSLDQTRPITLGGGSTAGANDPSWQYVNVGDVHYNANGQGYGPIHAAHPGHAMTQSESWPATVYEDWAFVEQNEWAVGNWVWAAWDYLGESGLGRSAVAPAGTYETIENQTVQPGWSNGDRLYLSYGGYGYGYPWFQSNCGDIDLIGQRKPQNYWRAAVYGFSPAEVLVERPVPPGTEQDAVWWGYYDEQESWTWDAGPGQSMTVHVYTPGDSVRLLLNGAEVPGAIAPNNCVATFTVPYAPGELTAIASRNGQEIGRKSLVTAGAPAGLRLTADVDGLTTSRDALAHVLVEVVDSHGRVVPSAVTEVTFEVKGAGELAAVANGNPHNLDSFRQPHRYTWHGRAQAILRPAKNPGAVSLIAQAAGLRTATLTLPVTPVRPGGPSYTRRRAG